MDGSPKQTEPDDPSRTRLAFAAALTAARYVWGARRSGRHGRERLSPRAAAWVAEICRTGYVIVERYLDADACRELVREIDRVMALHPDVVQHRSDQRLYGVETVSAAIGRFGLDSDLAAVAEAILGGPTTLLATLGARLEYSPGNLGSGEGWHRDSQPVQFKAIVYLTDVAPENGPFEFLRGSQRLDGVVRDIWRAGLGYNQNRISPVQVERLLERDPARLKTVCGKAGTLILVNTAAIHRGRPIESGVRYALTNYYFRDHLLTPALRQHFQPMLGSPVPRG